MPKLEGQKLWSVTVWATLPETVELPSAWGFAECIPSGTRQTSYLLSVFNSTLGKQIALGKTQLCECLRKNTRQTTTKHSANTDTRQSRGMCAGRAAAMWRPLGAPPYRYNFIECPLETLCKDKVCWVFFIDTRQTDIFTECFFTLGKMMLLPSVFYWHSTK